MESGIQESMLKTGDLAPDFTAPTDEDSLTLSSLRGKDVVLYFYPRDATPGCTLEAQEFRELHGEFEKAGVVILGVSKDTVTKHRSFKKKECLPFLLVSDAKDICEQYGIWREKTLYGKKNMGIVRATFWIGKDGRVLKVWDPVKAKGHAAEVLTAVKER
jgi:peroxiredoxin Q/BCP